MIISPRTRRLMAISGMMAPLSFVVLATAATLLTPDYSSVRLTVSRLAAVGQPYWWLVNTSFVLYCLLVQPLGPLLYAITPSRVGGVVLWLLVVLYGAGGVLAAVYRVGDERIAAGTLTGDAMHDVVARVGFVGILALCFVTPYVLRNVADWQHWRRYSLLLGLLTVVFMLPFQLGVFPEWRGALERGFFASTLLWVFGTSLRLYRLPVGPLWPGKVSSGKRGQALSSAGKANGSEVEDTAAPRSKER